MTELGKDFFAYCFLFASKLLDQNRLGTLLSFAGFLVLIVLAWRIPEADIKELPGRFADLFATTGWLVAAVELAVIVFLSLALRLARKNSTETIKRVTEYTRVLEQRIDPGRLSTTGPAIIGRQGGEQ